MAADSAATIYPENRTFYSQKKIFPLPYPHSIAFMVHDKLRLNAVPWETLITIYINHLGPVPLTTAHCYAEGLIDFLKERQDLFLHDDAQMSWTYDALNYLENLSAEMRQQWQENSGDLQNPCFRSHCKNHIENLISELNTQADCPGMKHASQKEKIRAALNNFGLDFVEQFLGIFNLSEDFYNSLYELLTLLTIKDTYSFGHTGIVCAGYGHQEIFPAVSHIKVGGVYFEKLKYSYAENHKISNKNQAQIIPYAATDSVSAFMKGVHPRYEDFSLQEFKEIMNDFLCDVLGHAGKSAQTGTDTLIDKYYTLYKKKLSRHVMAEHIYPVIENIRFLPHEGLVEIAKSLVNMTSFKSALSHNDIRVGGKTEVGLITKAQGFQWQNRPREPACTAGLIV